MRKLILVLVLCFAWATCSFASSALTMKNYSGINNGSSLTTSYCFSSNNGPVTVACTFTRGATSNGDVTIALQGSISNSTGAWTTLASQVVAAGTPGAYTAVWGVFTAPGFGVSATSAAATPMPFMRLLITNTSGATITNVSAWIMPTD
jgi:hypothetical protein